MKFKLLLLVLLLFSALSLQSQEYLEMIDSGTYSVEEIVLNAENYFEKRDKGRGSGYKQFKRWEYNAKRLMNENGFLPSVLENLTELQRYEAYLNQTSHNRLPLNDNWQELGPMNWNATTSWNPGVGRVTSIAIDPLDSNHIIVGANTGGVWKTEDAGATWIPLHDNFTNLSVYSVTIDPSNSDIYFFGSSDGLIFKSEDAGATWNFLSDAGNSLVNKILLHPTNSNMMFITMQNGGIKRSVDAGATWQQTISDNNGYDVEFNPADPMIVYASGSGFYKSVDGGETFSTINGFTNGPKMIGVSAADPDRVYVVEADSGIFGAFYSSIDAGDSFNQLPHGTNNYFGYSTSGNDNSGQAPRDMDIAVNPNDATEVHIAGVLTWRSTDSGASFSCTSDWIPNAAAGADIGYCHADVDIMVFDGTTLYVGTDGGIFKAVNTSDISATYYTDLSTGLGIRQFYKIGVSQTEDVTITGGSQDNGTSFYTEANGWKDWIGADGMEGFVDKDNADIMYGMIQFGAMYRTDNGANSLIGLNNPGPGFGEWVSPFEQDPEDPNTIYVGYDGVYKSVNKGVSWTPISQNFGSNLTNLKIAPSNHQIMYASRGIQMYRTEDGGATDWVQVTTPTGMVNSIAIHPTNPNKIAVATTSFNKVFVSNDGGQSWETYKKNLPNFSSLALVWDKNGQDGLYLGMNYGIYYIDNSFTDWQPYSNNLPNVIINELDINNTTNMLYAATYGRGLFASPLVEDVLGISERFNQSNVLLFPNPADSQITISLSESFETDIRIFDLTGKIMVYTANAPITDNYKLDISSLPSGVYFIRLSSEAGTVTKKLIKK